MKISPSSTNDRALDADAHVRSGAAVLLTATADKDVGVPGVVDVDDFELLPEAARDPSLNDAGERAW